MKNKRYALNFNLPSRTKQSFKEECDINSIMRKYRNTGVVEHARQHQGTYGDFLSAVDYKAAMLAVIDANQMFSALPAKVRARFDNDPSEFLGFVQNPENAQEMIDLGLAEKRAVPPVVETQTEEKT